MKYTQLTALLLAPVLATGLLLAGTGIASAQTPPPGTGGWQAHGEGRVGMGMGFGRGNGVGGTVSAISGTTLTVTGRNNTVYTIDGANATVTKNGSASSIGSVAVGDTVMAQGTVNGTSVTATTIRDGMVMGRPGVFGTVSAINGNSITVTGKTGPKGGTAVTYTVDATSATVTKNNVASSVSAIAVGDTVMVQGTVSGTSVTATSIRDGLPQMPKEPMTPPVITGNGQPVVGGTITAINGSSLTITNKSNVTYTVDATSATIEKGNAASSLSAVAVGDTVVVQGAVNGSSVTATSVIDQGVAPVPGAPATPGTHPATGGSQGFFGAIGNFFRRIFGF